MVGDEGQLPSSWGEDQIAPILQNFRCGSVGETPGALEKVIALGQDGGSGARAHPKEDVSEAIYGKAREAAGLMGRFTGARCHHRVLYCYREFVGRGAEACGHRRITALARDALWSDGPATAIMVASHVRSVGLSEAPEAERLLLTSLHQLREERILAGGHTQMVNGVSFSPGGDALVSSDPQSLLFSNVQDGVSIDRIGLPYLQAKSQSEPSNSTSASKGSRGRS